MFGERDRVLDDVSELWFDTNCKFKSPTVDLASVRAANFKYIELNKLQVVSIAIDASTSSSGLTTKQADILSRGRLFVLTHSASISEIRVRADPSTMRL